MKRILFYFLLLLFFYNCGSNERGELVGVTYKKKWFAEKPLGMTLVPGGSYTMGKQDEDIVGSLNAPTKTVTVIPFFMDETEITNSKYKQFVVWVRDSVTRTKLALQAEFASPLAFDDETGESSENRGGIQDYAFFKMDTVDATPYDKYMFENYYDIDSLRPLDWSKELIWEESAYPDVDYVEVMDSLHIKPQESIDGQRTFNTTLLNYKYSWIDLQNAIKKGGSKKDFIIPENLNIYPDTTVWVKDFNYSYNDPMHQEYFHHQAYSDYPVVGVNWHQARAFCSWRTKVKNDYLRGIKNPTSVPSFRLPTEAEWEFAARGGLDYAKYPWGYPSTLTDRGCFLANFKPNRGDYARDGALYTMEAKSFNANDYGLYNMAGNVSEWTNTSYNASSYSMGSTMNPYVGESNNKKKIIRGGSWKDVAYFLEVSSRDYEYADTTRSYIGFRTVQNFIGNKSK